MTHVLTETQLRAAVAVAEARAENDRHIALAIGFKRVIDDKSRDAITRGIAYVEHENEIAKAVTASTALARASDAWIAIRPSAPFVVRAGETLARIVADHTDGGTETASRSRDTTLVDILREFEGLTPRDGVR